MFDGKGAHVALPNEFPQAMSGLEAVTVEYWFKGTSFQSALRHGGKVPASLMADLARLQMRYGERESVARTTWRQYLQNHPQGVDAHLALSVLGKHLLSEERWDEAESLFRPYAKSEVDLEKETALVGLIRVRLAQGSVKAGIRLLERYQKAFKHGQRRHEVLRLEKLLLE